MMPEHDDNRRLRLAAQGPLFCLPHAENFQGVEAELILSGAGGHSLPAERIRIGRSLYLHYRPPRGYLPLTKVDRDLPLPQLGKARSRSLAAAIGDLCSRLLPPKLAPLSLSCLYAGSQGLLFPVLPFRLPVTAWPKPSLPFWEEWTDFYRLPPSFGKKAADLEANAQFAALEQWLAGQPSPSLPTERRVLPELQSPASLTEILEWPNGRKKRGRRALLVDRELLIGSDPVFADLVFRDHHLARRQARLSRDRGAWYAEDLSGRGSSFLDGLRLRRGERCLLPVCCHLRLGGRLFLFEEKAGASSFYFVPKRRSPASPRPGTM